MLELNCLNVQNSHVMFCDEDPGPEKLLGFNKEIGSSLGAQHPQSSEPRMATDAGSYSKRALYF